MSPTRRLATAAACLLLPLLSHTAGAQSTAPSLPPHPRLLLDQKDVDALKSKIAGPFARQWADYRADADRILAAPVELPPRGGNWSHNYVCPEHGARLKQGKKIGAWEWEHTCPVGPHTLRGNPDKATLDFDGNAIMAAHNNLAEAVVNLGVVYQVTGDDRYAKRAREILLAYADRYQQYPLHDNQGRPGKGAHVASQSLTESSWLINVAQGADLVWSTLSDDDRKQIETRLLRPALDEVILPDRKGIHNIQCRHNSAIGLVGFLLNDPSLVARAIDDPKTGFRTQIANGVLDDGMWTEGASGYHFFTIDGLWQLAEAARHAGVDLYSPRFKSMFDAPLALAMPDFRLPNFNDSGIVDLAGRADSYEYAYAHWPDPHYLSLIHQGKRQGKFALLYGASNLTAPTPTPAPGANDDSPHATRARSSHATTSPASPSHNSPASGYAILQNGTTPSATWLCLKYGPHGGGHGHPDKNHFILYARGRILMPDAGTHAYGSPLHTSWDKTTVAHNTLTVDEKSQSPATGRCLAFGTADGVDYAMTDAGDIYPDAKLRFTRTVFLLDANHIVGIDQITTGDNADHTFDLAFHLTGKWPNLPNGQPGNLPSVPGYSRLVDPVFSAGIDGEIDVRTELAPDRATRLTLAGGRPTDLITATGIGETTDDHVPAAILRRKGKSATYVWSITLDGLRVQTEILKDADGLVAVRATTPDRTVDLLTNPTGQPAHLNPPNTDPWSTNAAVAVRLAPK
jgi:hypothetical protein